MKKTLFIFTLIITIISCKDTKNTSNSEEIIQVETKENLNIQTKEFSEIDSSGILIFPLKMGENKDRDENYSYKEMPYNGFWNLIFYNTKTKETHLLTEEKILILKYDYKYNREEAINIPEKLNHIFYEVRVNDFNQDKLINQKDPIYLFVSDKKGKNFRQISPKDYDLNNWNYIESSNKIIITATKDSNKNLEFDDKDEVSTFEITLDVNESPEEIFSNDLKAKLKTLYDKDWKRIK